jgi:phosphoribosylformylglycinamidine synthase
VVLSADPAQREAILDQATALGVPVAVIGTVSGDRLVITVGDERSSTTAIDIPASALHERWARSLEETLNQE